MLSLREKQKVLNFVHLCKNVQETNRGLSKAFQKLKKFPCHKQLKCILQLKMTLKSFFYSKSSSKLKQNRFFFQIKHAKNIQKATIVQQWHGAFDLLRLFLLNHTTNIPILQKKNEKYNNYYCMSVTKMFILKKRERKLKTNAL
jgi:hypothetical protein